MFDIDYKKQQYLYTSWFILFLTKTTTYSGLLILNQQHMVFMMKCPYCGGNETKVIDSREGEGVIRRRRECENIECGKRFTTYERIEMIDLYVIKTNGEKEKFDVEKLKRGVLRALEKRNVSLEQVDSMINEIERELLNKNNVEIESKEIGKLVMKKLKKIDKVAYIRFASVYKDFKDINEFEEELRKITKK